MKIAYLHGLDANNLGPKNLWLKTICDLYDPQIDYRKKKIYTEIKKEILNFNPEMIIGSSMGGFFAYELAKEMNKKAIESYNKGNLQAIGPIIGQVMKLTRGYGNPEKINDIVVKCLNDIS